MKHRRIRILRTADHGFDEGANRQLASALGHGILADIPGRGGIG